MVISIVTLLAYHVGLCPKRIIKYFIITVGYWGLMVDLKVSKDCLLQSP